MSVAISWANKMQLAKCDIMVGFPISSHNYKYNISNMIIYYLVICTTDSICHVALHLTFASLDLVGHLL